MISKSWLSVLLMGLSVLAQAQSHHQIISVELDQGALESNLLSVEPLVIHGCQDVHVHEHHQQTSIIDSHVSTIEVSATQCDKEYSIEYRYDLLAKTTRNPFCSYQLRITTTAATELPQADIVGDCAFKVQAIQLNEPNEFVFTVSDR